MAGALPELELGTGERIAIGDSLVIGRSAEADVVLPDPEASRRHAMVRLEGDIYLVADLDSRNGTLVNGEPLYDPRPLRDGDEIMIGKTSLIFRAPVLQPAPAPALLEPTMQMPSIAMSPMQVLGRISRQISGIVDAKQLADAVTEAIKEEYGCEGASLILIDEAADELYFASVASSEAVTLRLLTLKRGEGIAGDVIERKVPAVVTDVSRAAQHASELDRALGFTSRSIIAAPVFGPNGEVLGALEAVNPLRKPAFDEDDLEFVSLVAAQLGVALVNARSWDAIERERSALSKVAGIRRDFVAVSPAMIRIVAEVAAMHANRVPMYLGGEAGTGKRLLARLTHETSGDSGQLVEISGAASLPEGLEDLVSSSTVHVTDVAQLSAGDQDRLARTALAAANARPLYVSGQVSLLSMLSAGALSPSLLAVLESGQRILPPLRSRLDELEPLVDHLVADLAARLKREQFTFSADAFARFREYSWPGNIAQLDALIRRVGILTREPVVDLPQLDEVAPELMAGGVLDRGAERLGAIERKVAARLATATEQLQSADAGQRVEAVAMLSGLHSEHATAQLTGALGSQDASVRAKAAAALALRPAAADALAARLDSETEPSVAAALLGALATTGEAGQYEGVNRALLAQDASVRRQAMRALRLSGGSATAAAAQRASSDPDPHVRAEALAARYEAGDIEAGQALADQLRDPVVEVGAAAAELCGETGIGIERLAELALAGEPLLRVASIRALANENGRAATATLIDLLDDAPMRVEAIHALGAQGAKAAAPRLEELAMHPAAPMVVRRTALRALAQTRVESASELLTGSLAEPELAESALEGLLLLAEPANEPAVISQLELMPARTGEIAEALGLWGTRQSVGPLLVAGSVAPYHELAALQAAIAICARTPDRAALFSELETLLESEATRLLGLQLLGELLDARATPLLLRYRDWSQEARIALSRLGPGAMPELLEALQTPNRDAAEETLAEIGVEGVPQLLPLLGSPGLGRAAGRVIQAIGEAALPALLDAAERRDAGNLAAVLQLIGRIGSGRLAPYMTTFLESPDDETRYAAIIALGDLPDPRGEAELLQLLDSRDTIAVGLATLALGRSQSARAFEMLLARVSSRGDRRLQYANAAAIGNFNLRQPPVLALIGKTVREGLPFSSAAMEAGFRAGTLTSADILEAITSGEVSRSQKLRIIGALGRMPAEIAVPALTELLSGDALPAHLEGQVVASFVRHEASAGSEIAALLRAEATRGRGIAVLEAMQEPRTLTAVLRSIGSTLDEDEPLRTALREKGDQLLGPLLDVLYENWDLPSLGLLWQLGEVVAEETGSRPVQL